MAPALAGAFLCQKSLQARTAEPAFPFPNAGVNEWKVEAMDQLTRLSPEFTQLITDRHSGVPKNCREIAGVEEQHHEHHDALSRHQLARSSQRCWCTAIAAATSDATPSTLPNQSSAPLAHQGSSHSPAMVEPLETAKSSAQSPQSTP